MSDETNSPAENKPTPALLGIGLCEGLGAWSPIETAPRDGTYVLVSAAGCGGAWVAKYAPVATSGYRFDQPWRSVMLNHWHLKRDAPDGTPTHWMHMPPEAPNVRANLDPTA